MFTKAPPLRVWTTLAEFDGFQRWHPFIRLSGPASEGASADYTFSTKFIRKALTAQATITRFRKPEEIGWRVGLRGILLIEELYEISTVGAGTEVRHRLRWRGLLARVPLINLKNCLLPILEDTDRALESYLRCRR